MRSSCCMARRHWERDKSSGVDDSQLLDFNLDDGLGVVLGRLVHRSGGEWARGE